MYLAPLNYDRFFKKVFSDVSIARRFLEDFFDTVIEEIAPLPSRHKITDDATAVEFDFRCKIAGKYVIIDMQQWYKTDIVKRFYLYHCLNTALQLEEIPLKSLQAGSDAQRETKDYDLIEPVITLIWLADDSLNMTQDYVSFIFTPEDLSEFIREESLWKNEKVLELIEKRNNLLRLLNNKTKQLDFLPQNRMIYALQKNIVRNEKYERYRAWFRLAEKSKNKNNKKEDFAEFREDATLSEVMRRLDKGTLGKEDFQYIEDYEKFAKQFQQHEETIRRNATKDGVEKGIAIGEERGIEKGITIGVEQGITIGVEQGITIGVEQGIDIGKEQTQLKLAENSLRAGMSIELTAQISELSVEAVTELARKLGLTPP